MAIFVGLLVLVLLGVCVALLVQVSAISWRVRDLERQLGELRLATIPAQRERPVPTPTPPRAPEPPRSLAPAVAPSTEAASAASVGRRWELLVGTNWLNKLGVLVFVVGIALLVRYSIAHVGPAGRVGIGFAVSGAMLAAGVLFGRDRYRTFGHGLIAGGWAGLYFTTFAMHGIPAARVIDSDLIGTTLLLVVAAAMILHALSARSEAMTALAFVVGYATIVLSPLTMFAAMAVVPLAAATALVAGRLGWSRVALLGAMATYAIFPIRDALQAPLLIDRHSPALYAMLGVYWLVFEVADIVSARRRHAADRGLDLFMVNALGALGAGVLELPTDQLALLTAVLASAGAAYLLSAIVRTRLGDRRGAPVVGVDAVTSTHLAIAASAALMALAAITRFSETRTMLVLLFETELVLASAVVLRDRIVRAIAGGVGALVSWQAIALAIEGGRFVFVGPVDVPIVPLAAVAAVWYANREWLRANAQRSALDGAYGWAGALIVCELIVNQSTTITGALVLLVVAAALTEAGLRDRADYRLQGYGAGTVATMWIVGYFLHVPLPADIRADAWRVLPAAAVLAGALALHLARHRQLMEMRVAAMLAAWVTVGFIAVFELTVIGHHANAAAWAWTGFALATIGTVRRSATLRWQGYALASLGAMTSVATDFYDGRGQDLFWAIAGIGALSAVFLVTRALRTPVGVDEPLATSVERVVREAEACVATLLAFLLWGLHAGDSALTLDWGASAIAILAAGTVLRERTLRWCGLGGLLACVVRLTFHDLPQLDAPARITVFVVLGLVLIGASWIYTRFRERVL